MTTVEEAKLKLIELDVPAQQEQQNVVKVAGQVLAKDVLSSIDMPPFPQSAMDGYALGAGDRSQGSNFIVIGEAPAGSTSKIELNEGECVRIFTGAPVPKTAKAVVQQEWVKRNGNGIVLQKDVLENMHVRFQGEQMKSGDVALTKGTLLNPAAIGFLQMLGITEVEVFAKAKVMVLVTGNELVQPGIELQYGQIYESNSQMLLAAIRKEGIEAETERLKDDLNETVEKIDQALQENDIVILSGGISVGDHDHVGTAVNKLGMSEVFYKVAQKPGKPVYFGTKDGKGVFGLPGNPAASLICFYEYVIPVIRKFMGRSDLFPTMLKLPLAEGGIQSMARAQFLKAKLDKGQVHILEGQSSAMLYTFSVSNALVYVPANSPKIGKNDLVEVHLLP